MDIDRADKIAQLLIPGTVVQSGERAEYRGKVVIIAPHNGLPEMLHELGHVEVSFEEGLLIGVQQAESLISMHAEESLLDDEEFATGAIALVALLNESFAREAKAWLKASDMLEMLKVLADQDEYRWLQDELVDADENFRQSRTRGLGSYLANSEILKEDDDFLCRLPAVRAIKALVEGDIAKAFELTLMPLKGCMRNPS